MKLFISFIALFSSAAGFASAISPGIGDHYVYSCEGDLSVEADLKVVSLDRYQEFKLNGKLHVSGINKDDGQSVDRTIDVRDARGEYNSGHTKKEDGFTVLGWFGDVFSSLDRGTSGVFFKSSGIRHVIECTRKHVPLPPEVSCTQIDSMDYEKTGGVNLTVTARGYGQQVLNVSGGEGQAICSSAVARETKLTEKLNLLQFRGEDVLLSVDFDSSMQVEAHGRYIGLLRSSRADLGISKVRMACTVDRELH